MTGWQVFPFVMIALVVLLYLLVISLLVRARRPHVEKPEEREPGDDS